MAYFPYTVTEGNITILIDGSMNKIPRTHAGFAALSEHLKGNDHEADLILQLLDKRSAMARLSAGKVKVVGSTVFYNGEPLHSTLALKMVTMMDEGFDGAPLARFLDNIMLNPTKTSRDCLFDFITQFDAPITEDGCFVAFKGVRENYMDCHSGTFDNSPGKVVQQDRSQCVEDPNVTCAAGLHVCASHYLDSFWSNKRVIAVKVNPRDVVSVPHDYNFSKMRVCEYLVLGDIEDERHRDRIETATMVTATPDENRVDAASPTNHNKGYIVPEGYDMDDGWPEDGDSVIKPGSIHVGRVIEQDELDIDDQEHPENDEWVAGDIARNDAKLFLYMVVDFNGIRETFVFPDGDDSGVRVVLEVEDEYCDECGDMVDPGYGTCDDCEAQAWEEQHEMDEAEAADMEATEEALTFMHEATGLVFTATEVSAIVDDIGQRGFQREYSVPRTTVQEWLKAIRNQ